jgi:hypothetical protein
MAVKILVVFVCALMTCLPAAAGRIVIDATAFAPGTDISNAIPGVRLSRGFPERLAVEVLFVACDDDSRDPPACDRNAITNVFGSVRHSGVFDMLRLEFDEPVSALRVRGFSHPGSAVFIETRILTPNEIEDIEITPNPPGFELYVGEGLVQGNRAHSYDFTAVPTLIPRPRSFFIGGGSGFYPDRIVAFVPTPSAAGLLAAVLMVMCSRVVRRDVRKR